MLVDGFAANKFGKFGNGRDTQIVGFTDALERDYCSIRTGSLVILFTFTVLASAGNAKAQQLVAHTLDEGAGGVGEVDLLAAADAAIRLYQTLEQRQCLLLRQMRVVAMNTFFALLVVEFLVAEDKSGIVAAGQLAGGGVTRHTVSACPADLDIIFACVFQPVVNAAGIEVIAYKIEMPVFVGVA